MYHRDYTQELNLPCPQKLVPLRLALPILGLVGVAAVLGAVALGDLHRVHSTELAAAMQMKAREQALQSARLAQARTTALLERR